ncbi:hypothetical protein L6452_31823 [Arctium lappa]|uniref:Uncharacterized protein n=1 Tax=Arctium lappa TaxID=4217 RepID=A0ACB8Z384_ARCLA|nr:hypothetical protein L6452_31823 [Arctium lappa]
MLDQKTVVGLSSTLNLTICYVGLLIGDLILFFDTVKCTSNCCSFSLVYMLIARYAYMVIGFWALSNGCNSGGNNRISVKRISRTAGLPLRFDACQLIVLSFCIRERERQSQRQ